MQTQTQRPNFVCVCVCVTACMCECVCVHALSDDVIVARKRIAFCRDEGAELKQQTERNKNWRRKWRENTQERMHESEKGGRDEEKLQRNKCRNKEIESQPRNLLLSPHLSALSCRKCKKNNNRNNQCGVNEWICHSPCSDARSSSSLFTLKICSSAASAPPHSSPIHDITHQPSDWPAGMLGRDWSSRAEEEKERRRWWCWVISEETSWPVTESSSSESGGQTLSLTERNINVLKMKNQLKLSSDQLSWDFMCAAPTRASWKQQHRPRGRVPTTTQKTFRRF